VDGTITMLEIANRDEARPLIAQIDQIHRIAAPNTMFFISTKAIVTNIVSAFMLLFVTFAGWEVVIENKLRKVKKIEN
jgi:hypothetical protein